MPLKKKRNAEFVALEKDEEEGCDGVKVENHTGQAQRNGCSSPGKLQAKSDQGKVPTADTAGRRRSCLSVEAMFLPSLDTVVDIIVPVGLRGVIKSAVVYLRGHFGYLMGLLAKYLSGICEDIEALWCSTSACLHFARCAPMVMYVIVV